MTTTTQQPDWKPLANLGDVNPIDHGGAFVLGDATGVYPPELVLVSPEESENEEGDPIAWTVSRIVCDRCYPCNGGKEVSDNQFHRDSPAWFSLHDVERSTGISSNELKDWLCSVDSVERATAYELLTCHYGAFEFDQYPLTFESRAEVETYVSKTLGFAI